MSSPLSADFGLLASSLTNGARGRVPNDCALLFGLMIEGRARALAYEEDRILQTWPGIVTTCLLIFKWRPTAPSQGP